jgi:AcrR family transcriptional regulator
MHSKPTAKAKRGRGGNPQATRARLIAVARRLYNTGGPAAVTVRAVCAAARITPPTLYWHFDTNARLVQAVVDDAFQGLLTALAAGPSHGGAMSRLRSSARIYRDYALAHPHTYHTMFLAIDPTRSRRRGSAKTVGQEAFDFLRSLVAECMRAGDMHAVDPHQPAVAIWSLVHGLITLRMTGRLAMADVDFERSFDRSLDALMRGLTAGTR